MIPAMIRKSREARAEGRSPVELWGSGKVYREFLHVDDLAAASVFVMSLPRARLDEVTTPMSSHLNVGTGRDLTLEALGRAPRVLLEHGLKATYRWCLEHESRLRE